jgi:hypothetical protein
MNTRRIKSPERLDAKTKRKVEGRIVRHKKVRYHNDAYLFPDDNTKICPVCKLSFANRKKWAARGIWPSVIYCSKRCQKKGVGK